MLAARQRCCSSCGSVSSGERIAGVSTSDISRNIVGGDRGPRLDPRRVLGHVLRLRAVDARAAAADDRVEVGGEELLALAGLQQGASSASRASRIPTGVSSGTAGSYEG